MHDQLVFAAVGVLFIAVGAPLALRRVRPNRWYGLRTPATFADENVWYQANATTGWDSIKLGLVLLGLALGLPHIIPSSEQSYHYIYLTVLLAGAIGLGVRGWRLANRLLRERKETAARSDG